ncbi:hypothetical protein PHYPO_G00164870 [Pangasianodon hypophthalmus]|uniref:Ig-like domain-containing protein n=1 Tax=Pangasianodon hypophthalmus TaxID=310915 RepID=A0A5N5JL03_PANHP|nr:hypothetical protein PHYPO_G00164870 [Pangasianodon hypophthalmus]
MKEPFVCFSVVFLGVRLIMASDTIAINCTKAVIKGKYGSSVILPCWLTSEMNAESLEIRWYRPDQFSSPLLFYQNHKIITKYQDTYRNRSSLTARNPQSAGLKQGDVSLRLDNLGLQDIGVFHCYVSGDKSYNDNTVKLNVTALGSLPFLSLKYYHDSVNVSCSSCGWFPQPSLMWKSTSEKGDALSDPQSLIYSEQENGLFCIYSWVILSSSDSNLISCSVTLSEDEKRIVSMDLGARLSVDNSGVWKILFTLALLCVLALVGTGLFLYRKHKSEYEKVNSAEPVGEQPKDTNLKDLRKAAVTITFDMETCNKEYLRFNSQGDVVRDNAADKYKGLGFPYELCKMASVLTPSQKSHFS